MVSSWLILLGTFFFAASSPVLGTAPVVMGVESMFSTHTNLVEAGELLLSELRCVNCHRPEGALAERLPVHPGPNLEKLSERVRFDYLVEWLRQPSAIKPGTTMPHLLNGKSESEQQEIAMALAHFLFSNQKPRAESIESGSAENGRLLFHSIGCAACHEPNSDFKPAQASGEISRQSIQIPSAPLGNLREKYSFPGLADFLLNPLESRPSAHMPRTPMSKAEANDLATFLLGNSVSSVVSPTLNSALVQWGKEYFQQLRCAACHSISENQNLLSPPLSSFWGGEGDNKRGCLAETPTGQTPLYILSKWQRQAIQAALAHLPKAKPLSAQEQVRRMTAALNCIACHKRDDGGGPEPGRAVYFQTTSADLEDEGRFPPTLTGVGRKLTSKALSNILRGNGAIRPYMVTRMPDFGESHAESFARNFSEADLHKNIRPLLRDRDESQGGRSPWGRDLLGLNGLGCISCHDLNGRKSLGIRAVDLARAPHRLRPEWFRDYLIDPAQFRPGTRMPSFWPEGKALSPMVNRNTERQIDSIWVYLNEIDQNRLPEGMESKGQFELKPEKSPLVFRTFMKHAGLHAIAVGFPQNVNLAFDSEQCRWALAWRGRFLDAEGTWDDRFAPLAAPLGTNVIHFSTPFALTREKGGASASPRFEGYRLDQQGVPTFLYRADTWQIEDTCVPDENGKSIRRKLRFNGHAGRWWFCVAEADRIEGHQGKWTCHKYKVLFPSSVSSPEIIGQPGAQSLWVPIRTDKKGLATLEMTIPW